MDERIGAIEGEEDDPKKKRREFDPKNFLRKWDAESPKVEVPPAVIEDVDNDFDLVEEQ